MNSRILAIDDDQTALDAVKKALEGMDQELDLVQDAEEGLRLLKQNPLQYGVIFVDQNLSTNDLNSKNSLKGDLVARKLKEINPNTMVVMISGDTSAGTFSAWLEAGVDQYIYKPFDAVRLRSIAEYACTKYESKVFKSFGSKKHLSQDDRDALRKTEMVSASSLLAQSAELACKVATSPFNVLILGETGTGKERIARAIHKLSAMNAKPFLALNCATFSSNESLLESELFGHEKGAFTGADKQKIGMFEEVQGGTIFLDELHTLSLTAQQKLLRVLQERKIRRVGGNREIQVSFRLITAGQPAIKSKNSVGPINADLYFRVAVHLIEIPTLRERPEDIPYLIEHFRGIHGHDLKRHLEFSKSALATLTEYSWPGNVRELENTVKNLLVTARGPIIDNEDLPDDVRRKESLVRNGRIISFNLLVSQQELAQRELILLALKETKNNVSQAAVLLDLARSTLRSLMKKFKIEEAEEVPLTRRS